MVLHRKVSGAVWLNLLAIPVGAGVGNLLSDDDEFLDSVDKTGKGALVLAPFAFAGDFITGGAYRRDRNVIEITLTPLQTQSTVIQEPNSNLAMALPPPK